MKNLYLILLLSMIGLVGHAQKFPVDTLAKTGPVNKRLNVVILGDGFTAAEMPKFIVEANNFMNYFLSYAPYNKYKDYFNFYAIKTPSNENGATNLGKAPDFDNKAFPYKDQPIETKDTYYGCAFGTSNIHRLVFPSKFSVATNVIANNFASSDLTVMISNTPWYGGSGGLFATYTLAPSALDIAVHEIGHSFSNLADEYWAGTSFASERSNLTKTNSASTIKWKNWLNRENVGILPHIGVGSEGWFKPTESNCLMQLLAKKNCAVCRETAIDKIIRLIKPIDSFLPSNATKTVIGSTAQVFSLKLLKPNPNSLQVEWRLDGQLIDSNKDQISVLRSQLTNKTGTLSVSVFDSTGLTKTESTRAARTYVQSWPLEKADLPNIPTVSASKAICAGESTTLTASNCSGSLAWSSGQTTPSIDVTPTQTTTYGVNCTVNGLKSEDSKITITVTLLPAATATNNGPYTEGATIELTGTGGGTYAWKGPASYTSTVASPKITDAKQANAGAYTLVVTKDNCQATATTTVVLNPPKPTLVASKTAVCADESVTLTASNCASTLAWSSGQTTPSIDVTPTQTTTYSVNCTVNGLKSEDAKVTITVTPLPAATATNNGPYLEGKTIELTGTGGGTYTWTGPASFASTEASPKIVESKVVNSGTYSLVVSKDGCKITVTTSVTVSPILSINPNLAGREATIYPNPAEDLIKIDLSAVKTTTAAIIELYDFEGRSLLKQESTKTVSELNIRSLTSGIYLLKINAGKYQSVHKVIKR